jgi:hypothetical protein
LYKVPTTVTLIAKNVKALVDDIHAKYDALCDATATFNELVPKKDNEDEMVISYTTVIKKETKLEDTDFNWDNYDKQGVVKSNQDILDAATNEDGIVDTAKLVNLMLENSNVVNANWRLTKNKKKIPAASEALRIAAKHLTDAVSKLTTLESFNFNIYHYDPKNVEASDAADKIKTLKFVSDLGLKSLDDLKNQSYDNSIRKVEDEIWTRQKKAMSRYAVYNYLKDLSSIDSESSKIKSEKDTLNNDNWNEFVKSLNMPSIYTTKIVPAASFVNEHFNPLQGFIDDQAQWANGFEGKILLSDSANRTASFDESLNLTYTKNRTFYETNLKELKHELKKI